MHGNNPIIIVATLNPYDRRFFIFQAPTNTTIVPTTPIVEEVIPVAIAIQLSPGTYPWLIVIPNPNVASIDIT